MARQFPAARLLNPAAHLRQSLRMSKPATKTPFFPTTTWTALLQTRDREGPRYQESLSRLCTAYWRPVYWWIRKKRNCNHEEAHDLTQEFFAWALEQEMMSAADPERGRFRAFLMTALRNFLSDVRRHRTAEKRGGGKTLVRLDRIDEENPGWEPASADISPEHAFFLAWRRSVVEEAWKDVRAELEASGKSEYAEVFRRAVLEPEAGRTQKEVAAELSMSLFDFGNRLAYVKRLFRRAVRKRIQDYVASPEDLDREILELFGSGS